MKKKLTPLLIVLAMFSFAPTAHAFLSDDKARQGIIDLNNKTQSQYQKLFDQQSAQNQALLNFQQDLSRLQQQNQDLRGLIEQNSNALEQRQALWQKHAKQLDKIEQLEQNQKQQQLRIDELMQNFNKLNTALNNQNAGEGQSTSTVNLTPISNANANEFKGTDLNLSLSQIQMNLMSNLPDKNTNTSSVLNIENSTSSTRPSPKSTSELTSTTSANIKSNANSAIDAAYKNAFEAMKNKQYKQAELIFKNILEQYSGNEKAAIAQYYLGNCYYMISSYKLSAIELAKFIKNNPKHSKVPDAYLAIASAQIADNQVEKAKYTLDYITKRFQGLEVAVVAKERLDKLR
jgi:tol-pal system protein YbgF